MIDWVHLESELDLVKTLSEPSPTPFLILKHSYRCALSSMAKNRFEKSPDDRLQYYLIDVVKNREVSNHLSQYFDVRHESPQAFLFVNQRLQEVKSHLAISPSSFSALLDEQLSTS